MSRHTVFFKRVSLLIALCFMAASTHAEIYYLHNDHLGNPQAVTDENRNIVWQGEYSPFGELVSETGSLKQPHRFPGQHADPETGLYYNYFRDYDPSLGRYVQSDPIGLRGGVNTYGYVDNSPLRFIDFYGLSPEDVEKIKNNFASFVNWMTNNGLRNDNPYWNNFSASLNYVTNGSLGEPYLSCGAQSNALNSSLELQNYDDNWMFKTVPGGPCIGGYCTHWKTEATSSNPNDPVIKLDPMYNEIR